MQSSDTRYDDDFYLWTQRQSALLRAGKLDELDVSNLAEEIESLGQRDRREIVQRLEALLVQLLTWWAQPEERCTRWRSTINTQRDELALLLRDSPSLQAQLSALLTQAYLRVRTQVLDDLRLVALPDTCSFTAVQIMDERFYPEQATL